jgi:iron complex transport system substrate-binding protein
MSSGEIDAEVRRRLHLHEPLYHVDADRIRDLHPDLLITQMHCEVCAVTPDDVERVGCGILASQVLALGAGTVDGTHDVLDSLDGQSMCSVPSTTRRSTQRISSSSRLPSSTTGRAANIVLICSRCKGEIGHF